MRRPTSHSAANGSGERSTFRRNGRAVADTARAPGTVPVVTGDPIELAELTGRILFDDFEDVFAMDVDGSNVVTVAGDPGGPEFDGAWSPDGAWVVYRDSTRGINENDEIAIAPTAPSGG